MRRWIIFRADKRQPGWEDRKYAHTGSLTKNLAEQLDCSDNPLPAVGSRPPEFLRIDRFADAAYPEASTHQRQSDWEVVRVESYTPDVPMGEFDEIVVCYCQHSPINADLRPLPDRQVSVDSFDGDKAAYDQWLDSQKQPVKV